MLKVPQSWSVLRNFEYLLASGGEGLQYTTSLKITTHVGRLSATDFREDRFAMQPEEPEPAILQIYFPGVSASIHLNALVRILLKRLPRQRITEFMYVVSS